MDVSQKRDVAAAIAPLTTENDGDSTTPTVAPPSSERRERVAAAGGELLGAVFNFLGELVAKDATPQSAEGLVNQLRTRLDECVAPDSSGRPRLTVTLPDRGALDSLAQTLARLVVAGEGAK